MRPSLCVPVSFAILAASLGCADPPEARVDGSEEGVLQGQVLSDSPIIGIPTGLQLAESGLWVLDAAGDPFLHLVDPGTGSVERSFGRLGQGPGEFQGVPFGISVDDQAYPWAWDIQGSRLTRLTETMADSAETMLLQGVPTPFHVVWLQGRIVGVSPSAEARFSLFSADGARIGNVPGRLPGDESIPQRERMRAASSGIGICATPGRLGFALVYFSAGLVEVYDLDGDYRFDLEVPEPSPHPFQEGEDGAMEFAPTKMHYTSCGASRDHLFAVWSGKRMSAGDEGLAGSVVDVFDTEGK
ncbi:MAG: hypothetical protein RLN75_00740, partial [Longimicrobiales bacterium]